MCINFCKGNLTNLAGSPEGGYRDGSGTTAKFSKMRGIVFNKRDNHFYVTDYSNNRIRKISLQGIHHAPPFALVPLHELLTLLLGDVTTFAGTGEAGFADGDTATATFNCPWGIAINNATGELFVSDWYNHRICKVTQEGTHSNV